MATKQLKFNLPTGKVVKVNVEETITIETFIEQLQKKEALSFNEEYSVINSNNVPLANDLMFGKVSGSEFDIIEKNKLNSTAPPMAPVGIPKLPRYFHQLGILVLDGSGSMFDKAAMNSTKSKEVNAAVVELFNVINISRVKQNFSFGCIKFDTDATVNLIPTEFNYSNLIGYDYDPTVNKGGGTHIFDALHKAKEMTDDFLNSASSDSVPHKVLVLLMSDGMCFEPDKTRKIAADLKSNPKVLIACAYFGTIGNNDKEAQQLLKEISSDSSYYTTVYDGEALRAFFEKSISQSSGLGNKIE